MSGPTPAQRARFIELVVEHMRLAAGKVFDLRAQDFNEEKMERLLAGSLNEEESANLLHSQVSHILSEPFDRAYSLMGCRFTCPLAISSKFVSVRYSIEQIEELVRTLPSEDEMKVLDEMGYALIAGPPAPIQAEEMMRDFFPLNLADYLQTEISPPESLAQSGWLKVLCRSGEEDDQPSEKEISCLASDQYVLDEVTTLWVVMILDSLSDNLRPFAFRSNSSVLYKGIGRK